MNNDELRQRASEVLEYDFVSESLLRESLTHASIADNRLNSNERMEFLGDAVLDLVVCEELYRRFPEYLEGDLTKVKSAVVSRRTCAEVSKEIGLIDLLITGKGISGRDMPNSLAAAVYESVVAAIYLDGGFEVAKRFVLRTMSPKIDLIANDGHQHNFKALLQQYAQKAAGSTPIYELLDEKGPDHSKCFEVCVAIEGRRFTSAWGPNKKMAEQKAALLALEELGVLDAREVDQAGEQIHAAAARAGGGGGGGGRTGEAGRRGRKGQKRQKREKEAEEARRHVGTEGRHGGVALAFDPLLSMRHSVNSSLIRSPGPLS